MGFNSNLKTGTKTGGKSETRGELFEPPIDHHTVPAQNETLLPGTSLLIHPGAGQIRFCRVSPHYACDMNSFEIESTWFVKSPLTPLW
jgi:hypothetical protein